MSLIWFPGYRRRRPVISLSPFIWLSPSLEGHFVSGCQLQTSLNVFARTLHLQLSRRVKVDIKDTETQKKADFYT